VAARPDGRGFTPVADSDAFQLGRDTAGSALGLGAIKFWSRDKFHGANALKRHINPTRVPIEQKESIRWLENLQQSTELLGSPERCVHIGDRESDIWELFCVARQLHTHFLVRTCVDRVAADGNTTVGAVLKRSELRGRHLIEVRNRRGKLEKASLELRFQRILIHPPKGKQKNYPELILTAIHARRSRLQKVVNESTGSSSPTYRCAHAWTPSKRSSGTRKDGRSRPFTKSSSQDAHAEQAKLRTAERLVN